jgi:hypothetical protein
MSDLKVTLDKKKIEKALKLWGKLNKQEQVRELRKSGRALAVRLANVTAPFGLDQKARKQGEGAIGKDIVLTVRPLNSYWMNEALKMKGATAQAFNARFTSKSGQSWLESTDVSLNSSSIKQFHQKLRNKGTGRTPGTQHGYMLQNQEKKYIKETQKKVGIAKASWAECAGALGGFASVKGVGKIQGWVVKLISKYGRGTVQEGKGYIKLTSNVPWIGKALSRSNLTKSLDIQRTALAKSVIAIVKYNSKKAGFA